MLLRFRMILTRTEIHGCILSSLRSADDDPERSIRIMEYTHLGRTGLLVS
jgi:hypothetical protein